MSKLIWRTIAALILIVSASLSAFSQEDGRPTYLTRAVFAEGRLWLLSELGKLSFVFERDKVLVHEHLPEPVLDLCVRNGRPVVLTGTREGTAGWTIRSYENGWRSEATFQPESDFFLAFGCSSNGVAIITTDRLLELQGGHLIARPFSKKVKGGFIGTLHAEQDAFFVGWNSGEFGGGLERIDRASNEVTKLEQNDSNELCGGPLNPECDPVNGIAPHPWKTGCIAAAIGLNHLVPHGRIVEICDGRIGTLYSKPHETAGRFSNSVVFEDLKRDRNSLFAAGMDGFYRIRRGGEVDLLPMPHFKEVGGIYMSFDLPRFIIVLSRTNWPPSIGDLRPILVAR